ncbi:hypothetical protein SAY87_008039 [Trapa incisa]|uniref:Alpha-L-fucosidase n=1 Tax=Trapa incisa TaxID=236973 RepID=A0AAN7QFN0_9MYRT|nr:hypothetical protein SAY87_008039 [Trapa incisa]
MTALSPPFVSITLILFLSASFTGSLYLSGLPRRRGLPTPALSLQTQLRISDGVPPAAPAGGGRTGLAAEANYWDPTAAAAELEAQESKRPPLKVRFREPAKHWTDALPIGNGRLGAMVWGGVAIETLQLNEDTLWTGTPGNYTNPDARRALSAVRKLVEDGQFAEATQEATHLSGLSSNAYQLLGDVSIEFNGSHLSYDGGSYTRELDLDTATATVKYSVNNVRFTREYFVSHPDQVIVMKYSSSRDGSISFTASLNSKLYIDSYAIVNSTTNHLVLRGRCPGSRTAQSSEGIRFAAVLDVQVGGKDAVVNTLDGKKLSVKNSNWAVLVLDASSSFSNPFTEPSESGKDPTAAAIHNIGLVRRSSSYAELLARHLDDYQALFRRASIQLSDGASSSGGAGNVTTAERVGSFRDDEDPSLVELLFQYGRYLLITSSRPGTQVANLQGIWNKDIYPPWDGAPHLNINLQMNYWASLSCNLRECQEPLFDYISSLSVNGQKTAKVNYGADGWVAHQVSDIWAKTSPDQGDAVWAIWPMGGAWLCTHLWEHYTYTMDTDFLEFKAYPLMEGCTSFLLDWLIQGRDGYLETNPSTSPENTFTAPDGKSASVSYSTTMDMAIIKEVFSAIVSAAEILGKKEDAIIKRVVAAQPRLPPYRVSKDGSLMEWAEDFVYPETHHRHLSHLFGLFPGHTITVEQTPNLSTAANCTLHKRGEDGPGWSTVWKMALWARLQSSDNAYRMVQQLFNLVNPDNEGDYAGGLYSNLFMAHPPFQIDANLGFPGAVAEMIVQSTMQDIHLLPALPRDKWVNGCAKGLRVRGGLTISICWTKGDLHELGLWSNHQRSTNIRTLHYRGSIVTASIYPGSIYTFNMKLECVRKQSI